MPLIIPLVLFIAAWMLAAAYYFYRVAFYPRVIPWERTYAIEVENKRFNELEFASWERETIQIPSPYGYTLFGYYFPCPNSNKTVVMSHGITYSLYGQVKYMPVFRRRGYNILLYDLRHHGRSGGHHCTFGFYEKNDLKAVVDWAFKRLGPGGTLGTQGESLGAAITLQHAALDPRLSFAIADCPFSDLTRLFAIRLRADYHLPVFPLLPLASMVCKVINGVSFADISPLRDISKIEFPLMLAHGDQDTYIPPFMSQEIYRAKQKGQRWLYIAPGAAHAQSTIIQADEYQNQVNRFLDQIEQAAGV